MKNLFKLVNYNFVIYLKATVMIAVILGVTAFLKADFNPLHWSESTRLLSSVIAILYGFIAGRTAVEFYFDMELYFPNPNEKNSDEQNTF